MDRFIHLAMGAGKEAVAASGIDFAAMTPEQRDREVQALHVPDRELARATLLAGEPDRLQHSGHGLVRPLEPRQAGKELEVLARRQPAVERRRIGTGHTIATIDDNFHRPRQFDIAGDALQISLANVVLAIAAAAINQIAVCEAQAQSLNRFSRQSFTTQHHFQPIVVGRVMAAGDHHPGIIAQLMGGEVKHGGGDHSHIYHVDTTFLQTSCQCLC